MVDWGKRVFFGSLIGVAVGVLLGMGLARILWPTVDILPPSTFPPTDTRQAVTATQTAVTAQAESHDGVIILVSALYTLDGDLERARQRLAGLGLEDPEQVVAELARRHASTDNQKVATDLATLAAALGYESTDLLAYVATATPTPTFPPSATASPLATSTLMPSDTPSPPPTSEPLPTVTSQPTPTRQPSTRRPPTATPSPPAATPLPLKWDMRVSLLSPPVRLLEADVSPGQTYWRLVRLEWWKAGEGGNTLIYISALDEKGQPVWGQEVIVENGGHTILYTDPKPGEAHGANFPMSSTLNSYQVFIGGDLSSDRVVGLGLGEWLGGLDHTTFVLVFQQGKK